MISDGSFFCNKFCYTTTSESGTMNQELTDEKQTIQEEVSLGVHSGPWGQKVQQEILRSAMDQYSAKEQNQSEEG